MQDTSDGRRKNQIIKPRTANEPEWAIGRSTRPIVVRKREDSDQSAATGAVVRKTATAAPMRNREARRIPAQRSWANTKSSESKSRGSAYYETREEGRRPSSGPRQDRSAFPGRKGPGGAAAMRKPEVRRKPDQRPWPSTRKSAPGSRGPGVVPGYGVRSVSSARPATRAGAGRPAPGAVSGRPETRRKPAPRSWPGSKNSDSRSRGSGYETRSEGRWPSSGPRPNKSTHTGGRGPGRGQKPGSRRPGQGASNRGPRR